MATQTLQQSRAKTMRVALTDALNSHVTAKDVALALIARIGALGATGHAVVTPFTTLTGVVAPLHDDNVDTDIILPEHFMLITAHERLGRHTFHDRRYDAAGVEIAGFVLNRPPWRNAPILVATSISDRARVESRWSGRCSGKKSAV